MFFIMVRVRVWVFVMHLCSTARVRVFVMHICSTARVRVRVKVSVCGYAYYRGWCL